MPVRIQRKRTRGWRMPKGAVYVGRPSNWGNPYAERSMGDVDPALLVALYRDFLRAGEGRARIVLARLPRLRGKDLACWCPLADEDGNPVPCHADVLLELANK